VREGWTFQTHRGCRAARVFCHGPRSCRNRHRPRLRLNVSRQPAAGYQERVDISGTTIPEFVDELEKLEEIKFDKVNLGKDRLEITPSRQCGASGYDVALPVLSPALVRKRSLSEEIRKSRRSATSLPPFTIRLESDDPGTFT